MSKIKKSDLLQLIQEQADMIEQLANHIALNKQSIIKLENQSEPQLKQLDQSVFDGLEKEWWFAAVDEDGVVCAYREEPLLGIGVWMEAGCTGFRRVCRGCDASNWQNSLIERDDIAKELAEVDLSSELTGSELCKAMLARGDKYVLCYASDLGDKYAVENRGRINLMTHTDGDGIFSNRARWRNAVPINQRTGEPLTASEVGL